MMDLQSNNTVLAQTRVIYQWLRVEQLDQWWHWLLLGLVVLAFASYVWFWYRRDCAEHPRPVGWAMALLRIAALAGLLLYFMQLEKRTEQRVVRDSRVAILVDTSMSMSLPGTPSVAGLASSMTRSEEAARLIGQSELLEQLSQKHQLSVYRFDQQSRPTALAAIEKLASASTTEIPQPSGGADNQPASAELASLSQGRRLMLAAIVVGALAALAIVISLSAQILGYRDWAAGGWLLLIGSVLTLVSLATSAFAMVPNTTYPLAALFGADAVPLSQKDTAIGDANTVAEDNPDLAVDGADSAEPWSTQLAPRGSETRLGEAMKSILDREAGGPMAGLVLLTDGRNNAGLAPKDVLAVAQNAQVPLYVIGLGASQSPPNLELVELDVPKRLYPGDRFTLTALVGSSGFAGRTATVQILAGPVDTPAAQLSIEEELNLQLPDDGSLATATFQLPPKQVGEWQYAAKVLPLTGENDANDNLRSTSIEVIERKNRVLILAGGPTREYQFVRNLLYRDRDVESHVLLQTGGPSTSQEAQELLTEFPSSRTDLSEYDAVLAFDPDWTAIPEESVVALEQWVAEQAGGLLMVAGSVEMPKWLARSADTSKTRVLRSLSPVVMDRRGSALLASGRVEADTAWPLTLTSDGRQSEFLWLTDDAKSSFEIWNDFDGVYSFYSAYELKPGAKALLNFSDPTAAVDGQQPIYLANQYYGAGRTAFLGGGELWRIRTLGDQYFDRFYTKLVRWVSQGRLLLDSDRGVLLVDREQALLGDQVTLRAVLKNERYEPLVQTEVVARLVDPQGRNSPLVLRPFADGSQPGVYSGQFPIVLPGDYVAQLQLGGLASNEMLNTTVRAKVPAIEMQRAERDDVLLRTLAVETGGKYWAGVEAAVQPVASGNADLIDAIEPQDQVAFLPGAPDQTFQLRWLGWLMAWIAGCLSLEWLSRRLHRLA